MDNGNNTPNDKLKKIDRIFNKIYVALLLLCVLSLYFAIPFFLSIIVHNVLKWLYK